MGSLFPVDTWNHFSNPDDRTNNKVDSYNLKIRKFVSAAQPEINKAVNAPKGFETAATNTYLRAKLKDARANPSRREWHDHEVILKRSKAQYSAGKFKHGLSDYIEEIVVKGVNILKSDSQASQRTQVSCDWCHLSFASRGINKPRFLENK